MSKKLKTFEVPVSVTISSSITVQARDQEDAAKKARAAYAALDTNNRYHGLDCPCIDVDFAEGDDIEEYSDDEDVV